MTDIPARLAHRPVQAGMVVPWIALALPDDTHDFAGCEGRKVNLAMLNQLCQICGEHIEPPIVFFAADDQLGDMTFDSPPLHPACARYSAKACPMVAGRLHAYRAQATRASRTDACATPGCDCGGWTQTETNIDRGGRRAPTWFAVWCRSYDRIATSPQVVAAIRAGHAVPGERIWARVTQPLKIRPVTPAPEADTPHAGGRP